VYDLEINQIIFETELDFDKKTALGFRSKARTGLFLLFE